MIKNLITKKEFATIIKDNGVVNGMILEVYVQLEETDYIVGGAVTVIDVLLNAIGHNGTLVMNIKSNSNFEPSFWDDIKQNLEMAKVIRDDMPLVSKKEIDSHLQSDVCNLFKNKDGVVFSSHPSNSFVARGKYAKFLCNRQSIHFPLSEESCCARLYELRASTLIIGKDYSQVASLNLAQYRVDTAPIIVNGATIAKNGGGIWKKYLDLDLNADVDVLNEIGAILEKKKYCHTFYVGQTKCRIYRTDLAIDIATKYFQNTSILSKYK